MVALQGSTPDNADLVPTYQVAKDGYELRYNEPEGGITLWDLSEDTAIYVFDAENAQSNMLPEGVREVEGGDDGPDLLVFEHPETGEHLVSFTMEEPGAQDQRRQLHGQHRHRGPNNSNSGLAVRPTAPNGFGRPSPKPSA